MNDVELRRQYSNEGQRATTLGGGVLCGKTKRDEILENPVVEKSRRSMGRKEPGGGID